MNKIKSYYVNGKRVIEEKGIKYDYYNGMNDIIFKSILRNDKNHLIIKTIIKELLNIEIKEVLELDNGFSAKGKNIKGESCDYKVSVDGKTISLECNKIKSNLLLNRNKSHLRRMIIESGFEIVQINLDGYDIGKENKLIYSYQITGDYNKNLYNNLIKIFHINLSKLKEKMYNKDTNELTNFEKVCLIFQIRERKELEKILKGEEFMELKKIVEDISNDEDLYDEYSKSEIYAMAEREEGYGQGKTEGKEKKSIEIAKNMLSINIPIDDIIKCTGLSKEELEKLKN